jgi:hypothetical protein
MAGILEYDSNNSGGTWWLTEEDWDKLEAAGWTVHWARHDPSAFANVATRVYEKEDLLKKFEKTDVTYLARAKACSAAKRFDTKEEGIKEWEELTGEHAGAEGCNCCGNPHNFTWYDDSGEETHASIEIMSRMVW